MMADLTLILLIIEVSALVYVNSLWGVWAFDARLILSSPWIAQRRLTNSVSKYAARGLRYQWNAWRDQPRRLLFITYERDMICHGPDPFGWHLTDVAIHAVNAVLVYTLLLAFSPWYGALAGALVFAVHPLCGASVPSISGRSSSLCGMFFLAAMIAAICSAWLTTVFLGYLAWKCKEEAAMLPFAIGATLLVLR